MSQLITPKQRVNVRAIIYRDGKLLAVKHKTTNSSDPDVFALPGGGLDPHESLIDGIVREIMEETGIRAEVGKLLFVQQFYSTRKGYTEELEFFFEVTNAHDFVNIDLAATTHGKDELEVCEFIDPSQETIYPLFLRTAPIREYLSGEHSTLVVNNFDEIIARP